MDLPHHYIHHEQIRITRKDKTVHSSCSPGNSNMLQKMMANRANNGVRFIYTATTLLCCSNLASPSHPHFSTPITRIQLVETWCSYPRAALSSSLSRPTMLDHGSCIATSPCTRPPAWPCRCSRTGKSSTSK